MQTSQSDGKLTSETSLPNFLVEEKSIKFYILLRTGSITCHWQGIDVAQKLGLCTQKSVMPLIRPALFSFHHCSKTRESADKYCALQKLRNAS